MSEISELEKALNKFRRELLRNERSAASDMVHVYGDAWKRVKAELERLHIEYEGAVSRGEKPGTDWIYQYNRARAFRDQVERELQRFAQYAEQNVRDQMREAIQSAEAHAERLVRIAMGKPPAGIVVDWNRVPTAAVAEIVGLTQRDSPLHKLFMGISAEGTQAAENALIQGLLMGKNPRETALLLRKALGITMSRALRIARTETLRAYREATRQSYQANSDIVKGWVWHSALDTRTCAMCWAMHGTVHRLDERLDDHPQGRCAMVPWTATWAEIGKKYGIDLSGVPDTNPQIEPGILLFEGLSAEEQIKILGPAKYAAWREGKFTLSDLAGRKRSAVWGTYRYEKSLRELGLKAGEYLERYREFVNRHVLPLFEPNRDDVVQVGVIGEHLYNIFKELCGVRNVVVTDKAIKHYQKHKGEFDIRKAETLLYEIIYDPYFIYVDRKKNSVLFVGKFDEKYYLLVPIKVLPGEMWLQTLYIEEKNRFVRRWGKRKLLYMRK